MPEHFSNEKDGHMISITELLLPAFLSGVCVFLVSSLVHMLLPIHKGDFAALPGETKIREAMRSQEVKPGSYMIPCPGSMKEMGTPEHVAKLEEGPVGILTVVPNGPTRFGRQLAIWFTFCVIVSVFVAYLTAIKTAAGSSGMEVFRPTFIAAFLAFGLTNVTDSIWKGVSWITTGKFLFDGALYALTSALIFQWLWPIAS